MPYPIFPWFHFSSNFLYCLRFIQLPPLERGKRFPKQSNVYFLNTMIKGNGLLVGYIHISNIFAFLNMCITFLSKGFTIWTVMYDCVVLCFLSLLQPFQNMFKERRCLPCNPLRLFNCQIMHRLSHPVCCCLAYYLPILRQSPHLQII